MAGGNLNVDYTSLKHAIMKYHDLDDIDETTHAFVSISQIDDLIT